MLVLPGSTPMELVAVTDLSQNADRMRNRHQKKPPKVDSGGLYESETNY